MTTYALLLAVTFLAGFIQGLSGFGSVLLSLPLLILFLDVRTAIPLVALVALALTIQLLIQLRQHLEWRRVYPLLAGTVFGVPVGVFLLKHLDTALIQFVLGAVLIGYALYGLIFRIPPQGIRERWAYLYGFLAGCLGGALSASGPPVIIYTSLQPWTKDQIKVTLQGYFLASGLIVVFVQAANGLTTGTVIKLFVLSLPAVVVGTLVGSHFYGMVREEGYRRIVLIFLGCLGLFTVYRALDG
ncbi:MAG TPA: sulfite exporter TauE/SafE family protein [Syntrophales bacterium]|nr:sulfite exporter TauE/SafE family protein [Syntrophales bacterium]